MISFNALDRASGDWAVTLVNVDVSQLQSLGNKPVVYYSKNATLRDASEWTTVKLSDLSDLQSIAVSGALIIDTSAICVNFGAGDKMLQGHSREN